MRQRGGDDEEQYAEQRGVAGREAEDQCDADHELDHCADPGPEFGRRDLQGPQVAGEAVDATEQLAPRSGEKEPAQQDAADQQQGVAGSARSAVGM